MCSDSRDYFYATFSESDVYRRICDRFKKENHIEDEKKTKDNSNVS